MKIITAERKEKLIHAMNSFLVFLGFKVWVKIYPTSPRSQPCPVHHINMKRIEKRENGAYYRCPRCPQPHFIGCAGKFITRI